MDRGADALVGGAAADVAGHAWSMSVSLGFGILLEQRGRRHDLARLAVAALRRRRARPRPSAPPWPSSTTGLRSSSPAGRRPPTTGVEHERSGSPSTCTVQAPHWAMPQPYLVPVRPRSSRRTQSSGVSGSTSTSRRWPFTVMERDMGAPEEEEGGPLSAGRPRRNRSTRRSARRAGPACRAPARARRPDASPSRRASRGPCAPGSAPASCRRCGSGP